MRTATVRNNQSILDLAIQHCGSIEAAYQICVLNSLNIDAELTPGQVIILPDVVDKKVVDLFKERGVEPASRWVPPQTVTNLETPAGFRVPTAAEWEQERLSWASNDSAGAFNSILKLTAAGARTYYNGEFYEVGFSGRYWTCNVEGVNSRYLYFSSEFSSILDFSRAFGSSLRLIRDENYTGEYFTGGNFNGLTYQLVTNITTGRVWLDRNLGATQVATSLNDSAAYGDLYQWGRSSDGHQSRTSLIHDSQISMPSIYNESGAWNGKYIKTSFAPHDWLDPQNYKLWQFV